MNQNDLSLKFSFAPIADSAEQAVLVNGVAVGRVWKQVRGRGWAGRANNGKFAADVSRKDVAVTIYWRGRSGK